MFFDELAAGFDFIAHRDAKCGGWDWRMVKQVHRTGRPVVVTVKGKPDVIVLNAAAFEQRLKLVNLARLLAEAEADVRARRTRPAEDFFSELSREKDDSR